MSDTLLGGLFRIGLLALRCFPFHQFDFTVKNKRQKANAHHLLEIMINTALIVIHIRKKLGPSNIFRILKNEKRGTRSSDSHIKELRKHTFVQVTILF